MSPHFSHAGLIGKIGDPAIGDTLQRVAAFLRDQGVAVTLEQATAESVGALELPVAPLSDIGARCDLAVVVGGDGTLLRAARDLSGLDIAVVGINMGRLGFLTDINPLNMAEMLGPILAGEFQEEWRPLLRAEVGDLTFKAFNDVVIHKWNIARMIDFETYVDGRFVNRQRSDGLIVSTPTGSTAYALSGGGPLLHPRLDATVLVPICPHTLSNRPIVVDGNSLVEIQICGTTCPEHVRITSDGQVLLPSADRRIRVSKHPDRIRLIHPRDHDYYQVLRAKLGWAEDPS
jgi:NAD+ kinase